MVLSIRKISTETEDLTGAGALWFPNLNDPDPYMLLPLMATALNYFNLGVSAIITSFLNKLLPERNHQRERALVCEQIQIILPSPPILPSPFHLSVAGRSIRLLDIKFPLCRNASHTYQEIMVP